MHPGELYAVLSASEFINVQDYFLLCSVSLKKWQITGLEKKLALDLLINFCLVFFFIVINVMFSFWFEGKHTFI